MPRIVIFFYIQESYEILSNSLDKIFILIEKIKEIKKKKMYAYLKEI